MLTERAVRAVGASSLPGCSTGERGEAFGGRPFARSARLSPRQRRLPPKRTMALGSEQQVVVRFWLISALCAAFGIATVKLR